MPVTATLTSQVSTITKTFKRNLRSSVPLFNRVISNVYYQPNLMLENLYKYKISTKMSALKI